jgi:hypothetical protein
MKRARRGQFWTPLAASFIFTYGLLKLAIDLLTLIYAMLGGIK